MSEKAEFIAPFYNIVPVTADGKSLGVSRILPGSQPVHLDADIHEWKIKPQGEPGVFRLSLKNSYPFVGEENHKVIATIHEEQDKEWGIKYWNEYEAFSITLNTGIWPTPAWTVSSDKNIVLELLVTTPKESQLFKFNPAPE